jgi:hypothetical protein
MFRAQGGGPEVLKLALARDLNGEAPVPGELCVLELEAYAWHDAKLSRDGRPFPTLDTKVRIVGRQASTKAAA